MYHSGHGAQRSYEDAARWWLAAAKQGDAEAQVNLAGLYRDGAGVLQDQVTAMMWYSIASSIGGFYDVVKEPRQRLAETLSASQLDAAKERAQRCLASNYKNCD